MVPDRVIAEQLGCAVSCVTAARNSKKIPSYTKQFVTIDWDSIPDLMTERTSVLAKRLGCTKETVNAARRKRGKHKPPPIDWNAVTDLGVSSDKEIARRLGVTSTCVGRIRRERGIPALKPRINWRKVPELGNMYDYVLAEKLGCGKGAVLNARKKLGIPVYKPPMEYDWDNIPLGEKTDKEISKTLGISPQRVRYRRAKHKVPSFAKTRRERIREVPVDVLMKKGNRKKLAEQFGYTMRTISVLRVAIDPSRSEQKHIDHEVREKLIKELPTSWGMVLAEKYGLSTCTVQRIKKKLGVETRHTEKRTCLCGKEFNAITRRNQYCSIECRSAYHELRRSLDLIDGEEVNSQLFKMLLHLRQKLNPLIKHIEWKEKIHEIFCMDRKEFCERYGVTSEQVRVARRRYKEKYLAIVQREERSNETEQAQPTNDTTRQVHDQASY